MSIERVVVVLTPLFAGVSAWLVALAGDNVPGSPQLDAGNRTGLMVSVFLGVVATVIKWLHGRQKSELISRPLLGATVGTFRPAPGPAGPVGAVGPAGPGTSDDEIEAAVRRVLVGVFAPPPAEPIV